MTYRLYLTNSATGVEVTPEYNYQEKDWIPGQPANSGKVEKEIGHSAIKGEK